ncbi:MAG TPA: site-specific integrase, partial [Sedimentisphaerales bacterium]|nr:site-specific integrase [Sedimentisphaerales bacterium]
MASIFKQQYTSKDSDGNIIKKKSAYWYIEYKTADGIYKRIKAFKDKAATAQLAAKLEKDSELEQAGIVDRFKEHRQRSLAEHLEDFRKSLGDTTKHAKQTETAIKKTFEACGFKKWADIQASKFFNHLNKLKSNGEISQRTFNFYLKAGKQFCKWMINDQRSADSPLEHLKCETITKRQRQRRALETNEIRSLLEATASEPERFGTTGYQRSMLYRLAIETGLRATELKSLTVSSFDFDNQAVTIKAENAKNKKTVILPLKAETTIALKNLTAGKLPNVKVFNVPDKTAKMLRSDLEAAGIDYKDNAGRFVDFHSLRHTAGTLLAASGAHPKVAQSIMRHSDINLTMSLYTHTLRGQEAEAIENLPDLTLPSKGKQKATGTDNLSVDAYRPAYRKLTEKAYFKGQSLSAIGTEQSNQKSVCGDIQDFDKSLHLATLCKQKEPMSSTDTGSDSTGRYRARTCDP